MEEWIPVVKYVLMRRGFGYWGAQEEVPLRYQKRVEAWEERGSIYLPRMMKEVFQKKTISPLSIPLSNDGWFVYNSRLASVVIEFHTLISPRAEFQYLCTFGSMYALSKTWNVTYDHTPAHKEKANADRQLITLIDEPIYVRKDYLLFANKRLPFTKIESMHRGLHACDNSMCQNANDIARRLVLLVSKKKYITIVFPSIVELELFVCLVPFSFTDTLLCPDTRYADNPAMEEIFSTSLTSMFSKFTIKEE